MPREAPPTNTIYTGMLAVSLAAVVVGCVLLALELNNDYDWTTTAPAAPPVPARAATPTPAGGGGMAALADSKPALARTDPTEPAPTTPATIPAPIHLPTPIVAVARPASGRPAEAAQPVAAPAASSPAGITPSPLKLPGDRH